MSKIKKSFSVQIKTIYNFLSDELYCTFYSPTDSDFERYDRIQYKINARYSDDLSNDFAGANWRASQLINDYRKNTKLLDLESRKINRMSGLRDAQARFAATQREEFLGIICFHCDIRDSVRRWGDLSLRERRKVLDFLILKWADELCPPGALIPVISPYQPAGSDVLGSYDHYNNIIRISDAALLKSFELGVRTYIHECVHWLQHMGVTPLAKKGLFQRMDNLEVSSGPGVLDDAERYHRFPAEVEARHIAEKMTNKLTLGVLARGYQRASINRNRTR